MDERTRGVDVPPQGRLMAWRLRRARKVLAPELAVIWQHYERLSDPKVNPSGRRAAERCEYICIGVQYAAHGWPHGGQRGCN
jgi:hypothetical protein